MTKKQKRLVKFILWICILAVGGKITFTYFNSHTIDSYGLFTISIFIASLLELHTFGKTSYLGGNNVEEQKDELEEHIVKVSSKISYFALMVVVLIILAVSEYGKGEEDKTNVPLMLVFCATIVTLPFVQFLVSKKYK
ncbi:hypothetical protein [Ammoniphilus resinae]|uniref:Group-specific protein n=1 Tax=Ammoniphilus resinae TaxID=861532 RepID=A0ABS4GP25_9BACL|nr:hypothetical protein [Ammoniphilus resinae]MBP1932018.1 hypothetical protein [Ammoniphilus resinae]